MKSDTIAYLVLTITMLIWGVTDPVGKWMVRVSIGPSIPPVMIGFVRYFFATIGFILILRYREKSLHLPFLHKYFGLLLLMGLLSVTIYQIAYLYGLDYTAASDASLIIAAAPIWVLLLTFFIFNEPLTTKKVFGVVISFIVVLLIIGFSPNVHEPNRLLGDVLIILSMVAYASYGVVLQYMLRSIDRDHLPKPSTLTIITWVSVLGFISTIPFLMILTPNYVTNINIYLQIPERIWLGIIFLVVFATLLANLMFVQGISIIKASRTAIFANLIPLVAIITSVLFLGERFNVIVDTLSFFFIIFGVFLVNNGEKLDTENVTTFEKKSLAQL